MKTKSLKEYVKGESASLDSARDEQVDELIQLAEAYKNADVELADLDEALTDLKIIEGQVMTMDDLDELVDPPTVTLEEQVMKEEEAEAEECTCPENLVIYKYKVDMAEALRAPEGHHIKMPNDSEILKVEMQKGELCLWAIVNPEDKQETKQTIKIFGTGHPIPNKGSKYCRSYLGTVFVENLVWHVFKQEEE